MPKHMEGYRPKRDPNATTYIFKVALAGQKSIWRRIAMRSDQTLDDLHSAIFRAFDRFDEHLYSFFFPFPGMKRPTRMGDGIEYTSPVMIDEAERYSGEPVHNAGLTTIGSLRLSVGQTFRYLFDFGDEWWHDVTVEQTDGEPSSRRYSRIIKRHGASPPQYPDVEDDDDEPMTGS